MQKHHENWWCFVICFLIFSMFTAYLESIMTQYWVTFHILYIQKHLIMQIHCLIVKNDQTIIIFMRLRWWLNFLYDDMEKLEVCHDLLWVPYANAKTFRIVWTITKMVLCFSPWTMLFRVIYQSTIFPSLYRRYLYIKWYYWIFWYTSSPLALSGRYI